MATPGDNRNRFFLPLASFLNDFGWELPVLLLPLFITNVLAAGPIAVGVVEGVADFTGTVTKIASGLLSDRTGRRKAITASGYVLANVSRPFFFVVGSWPSVVVIRFVERVGKGLRTSARDALLADSVAQGQMGRSFGILRAMDSFGAFGSLLLGMLVIYAVQGTAVDLRERTFQVLVAIATIPGVLAVVAVLLFVREVPTRTRAGLDLKAAAPLPSVFVAYTLVSALFMLSNSSDAFIVLRSQSLGASTLLVVALMTGFNLVYAALSAPLGRLSDTFGKRRMIVAGWVLYALVYLGFARAPTVLALGLLLVPYGVYYALTEGIGRALVADLVPAGSRGAAFGWYHGSMGATALAASLIAGGLYAVSPALPFYFGAGVAALAAASLAVIRLPRPRRPGAAPGTEDLRAADAAAADAD